MTVVARMLTLEQDGIPGYAARPDGAGDFRIFAQVMLPLTRPALATVAIFLFLQNWNEFLFALTFITEGRMRTLPTGIYALLSSEFYGNYPILAASLATSRGATAPPGRPEPPWGVWGAISGPPM